jgi:penicillin-insensitive murein DD-endopeptidase
VTGTHGRTVKTGMTESEKPSPVIWLRLRPRITLAKISTTLTLAALAGVMALSPLYFSARQQAQNEALDERPAPYEEPAQTAAAPEASPAARKSDSAVRVLQDTPAPAATAAASAPQPPAPAATAAAPETPPPALAAPAAPPPPAVTTASFSPLPPAVVQNAIPPAAYDKKHPIMARELFGKVSAPAPLAARAIGFYAKGCLAGAQALPVNGPAWQAMRLSRNRNWGHPSLVKFIEKFAADTKTLDGWPGLLVGDMSQPRGGPMTYGHASHQSGLDVDMWFKPMPDRELTKQERDDMPFETLVGENNEVDPQRWSPVYEKLLRRAVSYPGVDRVFVNPVIKKKLCQTSEKDRSYLHKIKPIWGHDAHFHIRLACPRGDAGCQNQPPLKDDEGCGKELDQWMKVLAKAAAAKKKAEQASAPAPVPATVAASAPAPKASDKNLPSRRKITLEQLPRECAAVLATAPVPQSSHP